MKCAASLIKFQNCLVWACEYKDGLAFPKPQDPGCFGPLLWEKDLLGILQCVMVKGLRFRFFGDNLEESQPIHGSS